MRVFPTASLSIAELFSGPFLFNVPLYQRPYSWGRQQAERLLEDLLEAAGIGGAADSDYFLGTVLLMDPPGVETTTLGPKMTSREFDIVDGQQRLATLMTLFAVLRDLEGDPKGTLCKRAAAMITAQIGGRFRRVERFRLHLASRDRAVFEECILQPGSTRSAAEPVMGTASEELLIGVRNYLKTALAEIGAAARATLFDFIADRCYVVAIVSHDIDHAHRTFVVLNDRGRPLQRNDILKADLLKSMSPGDKAWAVPMWDDLSFELGKGFEDFFGHLRTALGYNKPQIVESVREMVRDAKGAEPFFKQVLLPYARAYSLLRSGGQGILPDEVTRHLHYLRRLSEADWAPAAILALKDWEKDPKRTAFLIAEIDRLAHVVRLLCSGSGKRVRRFADLLSAIRSGEPIDANHAALQVTREEERNIAFHLRDIAKRNAKVCKYSLLRANDIMAGNFTTLSPEHLTIEHVLPQRTSPNSLWQQWFPNAEERAKLVQSIGNLVLLPQRENELAKNASFEAKKEVYRQALETMPGLAITADFLQYQEWRPSQVHEREPRLLAILEKLWRLDLRSHKGGPREGPPQSQGKAKRPRSPT